MACNEIFVVPSQYGMLQAIVQFEDGRRIGIKDDMLYPTLNRKEAYLILSALKYLKDGESVLVHCYSYYIPNSLKPHCIRAWRANGWKNQNDEIVKNNDLLEKLDSQRMRLNIIFLKPGDDKLPTVDLFEGIQKRLEKEDTVCQMSGSRERYRNILKSLM